MKRLLYLISTLLSQWLFLLVCGYTKSEIISIRKKEYGLINAVKTDYKSHTEADVRVTERIAEFCFEKHWPKSHPLEIIREGI